MSNFVVKIVKYNEAYYNESEQTRDNWTTLIHGRHGHR